MRFSTSNQLNINDHLKAHLGYKSCPRTLATEDLVYGGTRTHDLVVESPVLNHSAIFPNMHICMVLLNIYNLYL